MRISDWSSDVCSSDLRSPRLASLPSLLLLPCVTRHQLMLPCQRDQVGTVQRSHLLERLTEMGLDRVLGQEDSTPNLSVRHPEDYEAGYLYFQRPKLLARTRHRVKEQKSVVWGQGGYVR